MVRYWTLPQKVKVRSSRTRAIAPIKQACDRTSISIPDPIRAYHYNPQQQSEEI